MPIVIILVALTAFWWLFIRGVGWAILLIIIMPFLCAFGIKHYLPATSATCITITPFGNAHWEISYAYLLSFVIIFLGVNYIVRED